MEIISQRKQIVGTANAKQATTQHAKKLQIEFVEKEKSKLSCKMSDERKFQLKLLFSVSLLLRFKHSKHIQAHSGIILITEIRTFRLPTTVLHMYGITSKNLNQFISNLEVTDLSECCFIAEEAWNVIIKAAENECHRIHEI